MISLDLSENRSKQQDLTNSIADVQDRLTAQQQQLQTEFSQVNALLEAFPSQLQAIQLELGITPTPNSSGATAAG